METALLLATLAECFHLKNQTNYGDAGHRSPYLSHAKRARSKKILQYQHLNKSQVHSQYPKTYIHVFLHLLLLDLVKNMHFFLLFNNTR